MSRPKKDENGHGEDVDRKRKRNEKATDEEGGLEIDVNLPEPPSKKARRRELKAQRRQAERAANPSDSAKDGGSSPKYPLRSNLKQTSTPSAAPPTTSQATEATTTHGIWIGNLAFTVTKDDLREFLRYRGGIQEADIARLNLPNPLPGPRGQGKQAQNRGFAYIDFTTPEVLAKALTLSETLLSGRKVLIKDAKNFEGRPAKPAVGEEGEGGKAAKKEPSKRVFVGNLGFDVTREDLTEHFSQAGEVEDVFLATFEDSGKCKGFGWVRFSALEGAENAVRGYIYTDPEDEDEDDNENDDIAIHPERKPNLPKTKRGKEKHFINRLQGRPLRCEFAEDAQTRYKKRFGRIPPKGLTDATPTTTAPQIDPMDKALDEAERKLDMKAPKAPEGWVPRITRSQTEDRREFREWKSRGDRERWKPRGDKEGWKPRVVNGERQRGDKEGRREERRKRHDARTVAPGMALANSQRATGAIVQGEGRKVSFD